ncbi:MAG: nucleoside 2-deoxyribosyltransferase [Nanoarchaeota archaeon]
MKAFLSIKFHEDSSNKALIEEVSSSLDDAGITSVVVARDHERWGTVRFTPQELMNLTFRLIDECDILLVEFSEKGVGLGIEAGYAHAKGKPIIVVARHGSDISSTLEGICALTILYKMPSEITAALKRMREHAH